MTEAEWLSCDDPGFILGHIESKASDRKLRLFVCAVCRLFWQLPAAPVSREAVEIAEGYADDLVGIDRRELAYRDAGKASLSYREHGNSADLAVFATVAVWDDSHIAAEAVAGEYDPFHPQLSRQALLLRCIFGNPFRPVAINLAWLAWNHGTVRRIAQSIYEEHAFHRMPILADALMDGGCDNEDILSHCRGEGPHVKGCWVVDAVLGKE